MPLVHAMGLKKLAAWGNRREITAYQGWGGGWHVEENLGMLGIWAVDFYKDPRDPMGGKQCLISAGKMQMGPEQPKKVISENTNKGCF